VILKLLAKRPEDRDPSAAAVVDALEAIEKEQLRGPRPASRRRRLVLAAVGLVGLLASAGVLFRTELFRSDTRSKDPPAPAPKRVASSRPSNFALQVTYPVGLKPYAVAVGDFNGDGRQDVVVSNIGSDTVSVLLGNGDGTFGAATSFAVGLEPYSVAVADVNGDGIPDVVAADGGSNSVSVLLGQRNAATHFTVKAPASVTAGTSFTITVTALTGGNQLDPLYTGTVHFTSSDSSAVLPADYTFKLRDTGSHTFTVTLHTTGSQTITATDTHTSSITGQATVSVGAAPPPGRSSGGGDSAEAAVAAAASPLLLVSDGTARLPALSAFRTTDASTHHLTAPLTSAGDQTIVVAEPATPRRGMAPVTVSAAVRGGQLVDAEVDLLIPAGIEAFFALEEWIWSR
jgi:hypothetical protein